MLLKMLPKLPMGTKNSAKKLLVLLAAVTAFGAVGQAWGMEKIEKNEKKKQAEYYLLGKNHGGGFTLYKWQKDEEPPKWMSPFIKYPHPHDGNDVYYVDYIPSAQTVHDESNSTYKDWICSFNQNDEIFKNSLKEQIQYHVKPVAVCVQKIEDSFGLYVYTDESNKISVAIGTYKLCDLRTCDILPSSSSTKDMMLVGTLKDDKKWELKIDKKTEKPYFDHFKTNNYQLLIETAIDAEIPIFGMDKDDCFYLYVNKNAQARKDLKKIKIDAKDSTKTTYLVDSIIEESKDYKYIGKIDAKNNGTWYQSENLEKTSTVITGGYDEGFFLQAHNIIIEKNKKKINEKIDIKSNSETIEQKEKDLKLRKTNWYSAIASFVLGLLQEPLLGTSWPATIVTGGVATLFVPNVIPPKNTNVNRKKLYAWGAIGYGLGRVTMPLVKAAQNYLRTAGQLKGPKYV